MLCETSEPVNTEGARAPRARAALIRRPSPSTCSCSAHPMRPRRTHVAARDASRRRPARRVSAPLPHASSRQWAIKKYRDSLIPPLAPGSRQGRGVGHARARSELLVRGAVTLCSKLNESEVGEWTPWPQHPPRSRGGRSLRPNHAVAAASTPLTPCPQPPPRSRRSRSLRPAHAVAAASAPLTPWPQPPPRVQRR